MISTTVYNNPNITHNRKMKRMTTEVFTPKEEVQTNSRFNAEGIHRATNRKYDPDGYDINGFTQNGWNEIGVHRDTETLFSPRGVDIDGYDELGWKGQYNRPWNAYSKEHWRWITGPREGRYIECSMAQLPVHKQTGTQYDPEGFNFFGVDADGNERP